MRKIIYPIIVFVLLQLCVITAITLWVVWYVSTKKEYEGVVLMAQKAYSSLDVGQTGYASMVGGILLLFFILAASVFLFIVWLKERLIHRQRADFFSAFSHELMTPITCVQMNMETLLQHELEKSKRDTLVRAAFSESKRLKMAINNILEMTKIEHKRKTVQLEPTDLGLFLERYVGGLRESNPEISIEFGASQGFKTLLDEKAFSLVLNNLFDNSLKYCSSPKIQLTLERAGRWNILVYRDNGTLQNVEKKNIFKMFYRGKNRQPGSGLGLYIVKNIVELHKGKIEVSPESQGTRFFIKLPFRA